MTSPTPPELVAPRDEGNVKEIYIRGLLLIGYYRRWSRTIIDILSRDWKYRDNDLIFLEARVHPVKTASG